MQQIPIKQIKFWINRLHYLQKRIEQSVIDEASTCEYVTPEPLEFDELPESKLTIIVEGTNYRFYDLQFMSWVACSLKGTFTYGGTDVANTKTVNIRDFLIKLYAIGESSVDGNVWRAGNVDATNLFLIKTAKTPFTNNLMYHEFFVGFTTLNKLRRKVANFMFTYTTFECSAPIIVREGTGGNGREVANSFCYSEGERMGTYVVIERVLGGKSIESLAPTSPVLEIVSWLYQLSYALELAYQEGEFCHYDLHTGNVLLRELKDAKVYVPVNGNFIMARYIPVIIDYGRSRVTYEDQSYGYYDNYAVGLSPDVARPEHDLYKLIGFLMFVLVMTNEQLFRALLPLYMLFPHVRSLPSKVNWREYLRKEREQFFEIGFRFLPNDEEKATLHAKFRGLLEQSYPLIRSGVLVRSRAEIPFDAFIYNCMNQQCDTLNEI